MNRFSKKVVTLVILLNVIFTGAVLYVFARTGSEPTALVAAWFAFTTGELWTLSKITRAKVRMKGGVVDVAGSESPAPGSEEESPAANTEVQGSRD